MVRVTTSASSDIVASATSRCTCHGNWALPTQRFESLIYQVKRHLFNHRIRVFPTEHSPATGLESRSRSLADHDPPILCRPPPITLPRVWPPFSHFPSTLISFHASEHSSAQKSNENAPTSLRVLEPRLLLSSRHCCSSGHMSRGGALGNNPRPVGTIGDPSGHLLSEHKMLLRSLDLS